MNGNVNGEGDNRLALADPAKLALKQLQKWKLVDKVPNWLLKKVKSVYVTKDPTLTGQNNYSAFLITETDQVLVLGNNTNGFLGVNDVKITRVERPMYHDELSRKRIEEIINFKARSTLSARTNDGKILIWGINNSGQFGNGTATPSTTSLGVYQVSDSLKEERVVQHCCSSSEVLCLTSSGKLIGWGHTIHKHTTRVSYTPAAMSWQPLSAVQWIGATSSCFFALTESHEVYSWGWSHHGRTLSPNNANSYTPVKVQFPEEVHALKVSCGLNHVLTLSTDKKLFAWGQNDNGQIGNGKIDGATVVLPEHLELEGETEEIEDVLASWSTNQSFCKTSSGIIYEWGAVRGKSVVKPTATKYKTFDEALMGNGLGMANMWKNIFSSDCAEMRYDALINTSKTKRMAFMVDGTKIDAWEFAVCRSPVLRLMLETGWKEMVADKKPIVLENAPSRSLFLAFMMYLHSNEIPAADDELINLVKLANRYEVFDLGLRAASRLEEMLSESNAVEIYKVARDCDAVGLVVVALDLISGFFWDISTKTKKKYGADLLGQIVCDLHDLKLKRFTSG